MIEQFPKDQYFITWWHYKDALRDNIIPKVTIWDEYFQTFQMNGVAVNRGFELYRSRHKLLGFEFLKGIRL